MKFIESRDAGTGEIVKLSYEDYGQGNPVVLIHAWPLSKEMWEYQVEPLINAGLRVITYDRRGFGKSDHPWSGYDYDSLTEDLRNVLEELDLNNVTLVGYSMGGGEVARYFTRYSGDRVSKVVLISSIVPYMLKSDDNPDGVEEENVNDMMNELKKDRIGFLDDFGKHFFGINVLKHPVSTPLLEYYRMLGSMASPRATQECMRSFSMTDLRKDAQAITVPTLIIHGDADKTVSIEASSKRAARLIRDSQLVEYEGAPHALFYTHRERLNMDLVSFITSGQPATDGTEPTSIATDRSVNEYVILPSNDEGLITRS